MIDKRIKAIRLFLKSKPKHMYSTTKLRIKFGMPSDLTAFNVLKKVVMAEGFLGIRYGNIKVYMFLPELIGGNKK